jgi:hypothetical protein
MNRPRAADDFATIRARMEELRREREVAHATKDELQSDPPMRPVKYAYGLQHEASFGSGQVRQSGPIRS